MMKKAFISFMSGFLVFLLTIAPFHALVSFGLTEADDVRTDNYEDDADVRLDVYEGDGPIDDTPEKGTSNGGSIKTGDEGADGDFTDKFYEPIEQEVTDESAVAWKFVHPVTDDVYYMYEFNDKNIYTYVDEDEELIYVEGFSSGEFPKGVLDESLSDYDFIFERNGNELILNAGEMKQIIDDMDEFIVSISPWERTSFEILNDGKKIVSDILHIQIAHSKEPDYNDDFNYPLHPQLKFVVDPESIDNWDNLQVVYYLFDDPEGPARELTLDSESFEYDSATGEVLVHLPVDDFDETVIFNHRIYGLFMLVEQTDDEQNDEDGKNEEETDEENGNEEEEPLVYMFTNPNDLAPYLDDDKIIEFREHEDVYFSEGVLLNTEGKVLSFGVGSNTVHIYASDLENYTNGEAFTVSMHTMNTDDPELVSDVVSIKISTSSGANDTANSIPFLISFQLEPTKVENWDNLEVRSYDDEGNILEVFAFSTIMDYDEVTGLVTVSVYEPGNYGIVEVPWEFDDDNNQSNNTPPPAKNNSNDDDKRPTGSLEDLELIIKELDEKPKTKSEKVSKSGNKSVVVTIDEPRDYGVGKKPTYQYFLPDTATNTYSYLLAGTVALLSGLGTFFFLNRRLPTARTEE